MDCTANSAPNVATPAAKEAPASPPSAAGEARDASAEAREASAPWATSSEARYAPVLVRDGTPYLFERFVRGFDAARAAGVEVPAGCDEEPLIRAQCPLFFETKGAFNEVPAKVTVLGPTGACLASVGEPVAINTSECETSVTLARRLQGCVPPMAPIAWLNGDVNPELRYHTAPSPVLSPVRGRDEVTNLVDPELRRRALEILDEEPGAPVQEGLVASVRWASETESLVGYAATFLLGDPGEGCQSFVSSSSMSGIERSGRFLELPELPQWDGVFSFRGTVVGVSTGAPHFTEVMTITSDGTVGELYSERVFSDNEECTQGGWAFVEHPCAP